MLRLLEAVRANSTSIVSTILFRRYPHLHGYQATCISTETGKILSDATSEVVRSLDMIEAACSVPGGTAGTHYMNDSTETHTSHEPLVS